MQSDTIILDHATFRVLLRTMSRPGSIGKLPHRGEPFGQYALLVTLLRCLMDHEVTHYVMCDPADGISGEILRNTGSSRTDSNMADFLIFHGGTSRGTLTSAKRGTLEYPDKGATAVYLVESIEETGGEAEMHGPGIDGAVRPLLTGLDTNELGLLREANVEFPLGVDAIFLDTDGRIMCIPRSTRIGRD